MLNPAKLLAPILIAILLGSTVVAVSTAAPDYATPSKVVIKIRNVTCPGTAKLKIEVWSRSPGKVKVMLRQKGKGNLGTDVIMTTQKRGFFYRGEQNGVVQLARSRQNSRYRIVATDGIAKTNSNWVFLELCKLVT